MKNLIIFSLLMAVALPGFATKNYQSVFLYNFTKYLEWPTYKREGSFKIYVVGDDTETYDQLMIFAKTKKAGDQHIQVSRQAGINNIKDAHIVFVSKNFNVNFMQLNEMARKYNFIVVTDMQNIQLTEATMNLKFLNGKVKFELDKQLLDDSKIKINSFLLSSAILVDKQIYTRK